MTDMLLGDVDNGRRATLSSALYSGDVGVRDRGGGQLELAWFGRPPAFRAAVAATLDGQPVTITGIRARSLTSTPAFGAPAGNQAIVATAVAAADD